MNEITQKNYNTYSFLPDEIYNIYQPKVEGTNLDSATTDALPVGRNPATIYNRLGFNAKYDDPAGTVKKSDYYYYTNESGQKVMYLYNNVDNANEFQLISNNYTQDTTGMNEITQENFNNYSFLPDEIYNIYQPTETTEGVIPSSTIADYTSDEYIEFRDGKIPQYLGQNQELLQSSNYENFSQNLYDLYTQSGLTEKKFLVNYRTLTQQITDTAYNKNQYQFPDQQTLDNVAMDYIKNYGASSTFDESKLNFSDGVMSVINPTQQNQNTILTPPQQGIIYSTLDPQTGKYLILQMDSNGQVNVLDEDMTQTEMLNKYPDSTQITYDDWDKMTTLQPDGTDTTDTARDLTQIDSGKNYAVPNDDGTYTIIRQNEDGSIDTLQSNVGQDKLQNLANYGGTLTQEEFNSIMDADEPPSEIAVVEDDVAGEYLDDINIFQITDNLGPVELTNKNEVINLIEDIGTYSFNGVEYKRLDKSNLPITLKEFDIIKHSYNIDSIENKEYINANQYFSKLGSNDDFYRWLDLRNAKLDTRSYLEYSQNPNKKTSKIKYIDVNKVSTKKNENTAYEFGNKNIGSFVMASSGISFFSIFLSQSIKSIIENYNNIDMNEKIKEFLDSIVKNSNNNDEPIDIIKKSRLVNAMINFYDTPNNRMHQLDSKSNGKILFNLIILLLHYMNIIMGDNNINKYKTQDNIKADLNIISSKYLSVLYPSSSYNSDLNIKIINIIRELSTFYRPVDVSDDDGNIKDILGRVIPDLVNVAFHEMHSEEGTEELFNTNFKNFIINDFGTDMYMNINSPEQIINFLTNSIVDTDEVNVMTKSMLKDVLGESFSFSSSDLFHTFLMNTQQALINSSLTENELYILTMLMHPELFNIPLLNKINVLINADNIKITGFVMYNKKNIYKQIIEEDINKQFTTINDESVFVEKDDAQKRTDFINNNTVFIDESDINKEQSISKDVVSISKPTQYLLKTTKPTNQDNKEEPISNDVVSISKPTNQDNKESFIDIHGLKETHKISVSSSGEIEYYDNPDKNQTVLYMAGDSPNNLFTYQLNQVPPSENPFIVSSIYKELKNQSNNTDFIGIDITDQEEELNKINDENLDLTDENNPLYEYQLISLLSKLNDEVKTDEEIKNEIKNSVKSWKNNNDLVIEFDKQNKRSWIFIFDKSNPKNIYILFRGTQNFPEHLKNLNAGIGLLDRILSVFDWSFFNSLIGTGLSKVLKRKYPNNLLLANTASYAVSFGISQIKKMFNSDHSGFINEYNNLYKETLMDLLNTYASKKNTKINIAGYSRGSTFSSQLLRDLVMDDYLQNNLVLRNYAGVNFLNKKNSVKFDELTSECNVKTYTNIVDPIRPVNEGGPFHQTTSRNILLKSYNSGDLEKILYETNDNKMKNVVKTLLKSTPENLIYSHYSKTYAELLKQKRYLMKYSNKKDILKSEEKTLFEKIFNADTADILATFILISSYLSYEYITYSKALNLDYSAEINRLTDINSKIGGEIINKLFTDITPTSMTNSEILKNILDNMDKYKLELKRSNIGRPTNIERGEIKTLKTSLLRNYNNIFDVFLSKFNKDLYAKEIKFNRLIKYIDLLLRSDSFFQDTELFFNKIFDMQTKKALDRQQTQTDNKIFDINKQVDKLKLEKENLLYNKITNFFNNMYDKIMNRNIREQDDNIPNNENDEEKVMEPPEIETSEKKLIDEVSILQNYYKSFLENELLIIRDLLKNFQTYDINEKSQILQDLKNVIGDINKKYKTFPKNIFEKKNIDENMDNKINKFMEQYKDFLDTKKTVDIATTPPTQTKGGGGGKDDDPLDTIIQPKTIKIRKRIGTTKQTQQQTQAQTQQQTQEQTQEQPQEQTQEQTQEQKQEQTQEQTQDQTQELTEKIKKMLDIITDKTRKPYSDIGKNLNDVISKIISLENNLYEILINTNRKQSSTNRNAIFRIINQLMTRSSKLSYDKNIDALKTILKTKLGFSEVSINNIVNKL